MAVADEGTTTADLSPDHPGILVGRSVGTPLDPVGRGVLQAAVAKTRRSGLGLTFGYYSINKHNNIIPH